MAVGGGSGGGGSGAVRAGRAFVELSLRDNAFRRGLDNVKNLFGTIGKGLAIGGLAAGGGLLAGGGLIAASLKGAVDQATELGKLSNKLGVGAEKLSAFAFAAEQTGVSFQELEGHFENFAERVFQGAQGTGEAADSFKKLGIDAAALKQLDPVDQLITLAGAMKNLSNETERLGLLSSFGGDQFQKLNDLFRQGPDAIRALMIQGKQAGVTLTSEQVQQAKTIDRAWTNAMTAVKSIFLEVGRSFFPAADGIKEVSDSVIQLAAVARIAIREGIGAALLWLQSQFGSTIDTVRESWQGLRDAIDARDFQLAFQIITTSIEKEFTRLFGNLRLLWHDFVMQLTNQITWKRLFVELDASFKELAARAIRSGDELQARLKEIAEERDKRLEDIRRGGRSPFEIDPERHAIEKQNFDRLADASMRLDDLNAAAEERAAKSHEQRRLAQSREFPLPQVPQLDRRLLDLTGRGAFTSSVLAQQMRGTTTVSNDLARKTLQQTEKVAVNTGKLLDVVKNASLVFAP